MGFLKKRLLRRFTPMARITDAALLGGAAIRVAHRTGLIDDETAKKFGATDGSGGSALSLGETLLIAGATLRLVRRFVAKRSTDRVVIDV